MCALKATKILLSEIKDLNKWKEVPCSWIGRSNVVKMPVLFTLVNRFNAIPIEIPASYFMDIKTLILKFTWRGKQAEQLMQYGRRTKLEA